MGYMEQIHRKVRRLHSEFAQLEAQGWTKCTLSWGFLDDQSYEKLNMWCRTNCKGQYRRLGRMWLFESAQDCTWFTLRWCV